MPIVFGPNFLCSNCDVSSEECRSRSELPGSSCVDPVKNSPDSP